MDKAEILWVSDLAVPTGFARVSHSLIGHLENKYRITGLGINYRGDPHGYRFPIFPAGAGGRLLGEDRLVNLLNSKKFDMVFILNDPWVVAIYLDAIKRGVEVHSIPKIVVYFPVDSLYHDPVWYKDYDIVSRAVTYTEFGASVVNDVKCSPNLGLDVIPHGVSSDIFYRKYVNRVDAKKGLLEGSDKDPNSFIFLNANRNQPRKRLDITLEAFKLLGKSDTLIHMHCGIVDSHINVTTLAKRFGIDKQLLVTNLNKGVQSIPDGALNEIYNAGDVGINSAMGEGWGLTSIEHAMTGAPQIVPDHSACAEIFSDCGLLVPTITNFTFDNSNTVGKLISPEALAEKMLQLYSDKALYAELSKKSIEKFSDKRYSWAYISEMWNNVFQKVLNADTVSK